VTNNSYHRKRRRFDPSPPSLGFTSSTPKRSYALRFKTKVRNDEEEEEEEEEDRLDPVGRHCREPFETPTTQEFVERLLNSPFSIHHPPPPSSSQTDLNLRSNSSHPLKRSFESYCDTPSPSSSSSSSSKTMLKNEDEKKLPSFPSINPRTSSNRREQMGSFARRISVTDAEMLLKSLIDRGDLGNEIASSVGSVVNKEMHQFSNFFLQDVKPQEVFSTTSNDTQLAKATELAPLTSSLIMNGIISSTAKKKRKLSSHDFRDSVLEKMTHQIVSLAMLRTRGNAHPPVNISMSLRNRHVFGSVKARLAKVGAFSSSVEKREFKTGLTQHVVETNFEQIQEELSKGAIGVHYWDNYVPVKNIQNKTRSTTCKGVHSITRMSSFVHPKQPIRNVKIDQKINWPRLEAALREGTIHIDTSEIERSSHPHLNDFLHHKSLPLKSGKYQDYETLLNATIDLQSSSNNNKICFLVQDSEFQAHHLKMAYQQKLALPNSISVCPTWHLMKHLIETYVYQPDFFAFFLAPFLGIVFDIKTGECKKYISSIFIDTDWKAWKKNHYPEGIDDELEFEFKIYNDSGEKCDDDDMKHNDIHEFEKQVKEAEEEEEKKEETFVVGDEIGGYLLRNRTNRMNPKVFGKDMIYEDEMKEQKVLS